MPDYRERALASLRKQLSNVDPQHKRQVLEACADWELHVDDMEKALDEEPEGPNYSCGNRCYEIGGPWISENPACPVHGSKESF